MNINKMKGLGAGLMIAGSAFLAAGFGINLCVKRYERGEIKLEYERKSNEANLIRKEHIDIAKQEYYEAKAAREKEWLNKIAIMDKTEFAKFYADSEAKANSTVIAECDRKLKDMQNEINRARIKCNDKIAKVEENCLNKVNDANKKRDEAVKRYEVLESMFQNKNEVLKAAKTLEEAKKQAVKVNTAMSAIDTNAWLNVCV